MDQHSHLNIKHSYRYLYVLFCYYFAKRIAAHGYVATIIGDRLKATLTEARRSKCHITLELKHNLELLADKDGYFTKRIAQVCCSIFEELTSHSPHHRSLGMTAKP